MIGAGCGNGQGGSLGERVRDLDVEAARIVVVHRRRDVLPVVGERGGSLVGGGLDDRGVLRDQVEEGLEAVEREQVRDVGTLLVVLQRHLRQLAMLGGELRRGRELDDLGVAQRALGEGREPAQRLDLVPEELDAHGPVLGRPVDVEDAAADSELPPLLDLVDALVSGLDEQRRDVVEVDALAAMQGEPGGTQRGIGDRLGERDGARDDDRRLAAVATGERVEGGDAQTHEVRRRSDVGGVPRPARGVIARPPRAEIRARLTREVAGRAVVGRDDQDRPVGEPVFSLGERREQVGAHARRHLRGDGLGPGVGRRAHGGRAATEIGRPRVRRL